MALTPARYTKVNTGTSQPAPGGIGLVSLSSTIIRVAMSKVDADGVAHVGLETAPIGSTLKIVNASAVEWNVITTTVTAKDYYYDIYGDVADSAGLAAVTGDVTVYLPDADAQPGVARITATTKRGVNVEPAQEVVLFRDGGYVGAVTSDANGLCVWDALSPGNHTFFNNTTGLYYPQSVDITTDDVTLNLNMYGYASGHILDGGAPSTGPAYAIMYEGAGAGSAYEFRTGPDGYYRADALYAQYTCRMLNTDTGVYLDAAAWTIAPDEYQEHSYEADPNWIAPSVWTPPEATERLTDTFTRPDSYDIGEGAPDGLAWYAGAYPEIENGTLTVRTPEDGGNGNSYAMLELADTPVRIAGTFSIDTLGDALHPSSSVVLDVSEQGPSLAPGIHMQLTAKTYNLILWERDGITPASHMSGSLAPWLSAGVRYSIALRLEGDRLVFELPDGTEVSASNGQIGARLGPFVYYQITYAPPDGARARWHRVDIDLPAAVAGGTWITGADILAHVRVVSPVQADKDWADKCALAVDAAITRYLGVQPDPLPAGLYEEVHANALTAGGDAYRRRDAPFGMAGYSDVTGISERVARDYIEGIKPQLDRWRIIGLA